jgi:hypothetical protein
VEMSTLNLGRVQNWIDQGRIDPSKPVTIRELFKTKCIRGVKDGVKLLAKVRSTCVTKGWRANVNSGIGEGNSQNTYKHHRVPSLSRCN